LTGIKFFERDLIMMKVGDKVTVYRRIKKWNSWFLPKYESFVGKVFIIQEADEEAVKIDDWFVPKSCIKYVKE
jgi:hypothetical protein